ncbi:MAG: NAD(P)H-dependent glycerol-3-phosphate dehydrogenase [Brevinema sp.]
MSLNITVLGAGSWGSALAFSLSQNHKVTLWNALPETLNNIIADKENKQYLPGIVLDKVLCEADIQKAVLNADIILLVTPSKFVRDVLTKLSPHVTDQQIIVSAVKGVELDPIRTITDLIEEYVPQAKASIALSGPTHAEDVGQKKFSCLVAASKNQEAAKLVQEALACSWIRVYTNDDPTGVQIGAAIKNIIAIAAGIVVEAGYGDNALAALVTRGIMEMTRFGVSIGGNPQTFSGLTGAGDLIVTCYSEHSRNRYVGKQIAQGHNINDIESSMSQVPEGVRAVQQIYRYAIDHNISMPIVESVYKILFSGLTLEEWKAIITDRPYTVEHNL